MQAQARQALVSLRRTLLRRMHLLRPMSIYEVLGAALIGALTILPLVVFVYLVERGFYD